MVACLPPPRRTRSHASSMHGTLAFLDIKVHQPTDAQFPPRPPCSRRYTRHRLHRPPRPQYPRPRLTPIHSRVSSLPGYVTPVWMLFRRATRHRRRCTHSVRQGHRRSELLGQVQQALVGVCSRRGGEALSNSTLKTTERRRMSAATTHTHILRGRPPPCTTLLHSKAVGTYLLYMRTLRADSRSPSRPCTPP